MPSELRGIPRRVFLAQAAGLILSLGESRPAGEAAPPGTITPYSKGLYLAGDHHIHTKYSSDGRYLIDAQVRRAHEHGLGWCVITDHGAEEHNRVLIEKAYPDLVEARLRNPQIIVYQGLEWNVPAAEHGTVIIPPGPREVDHIARFEKEFDAEVAHFSEAREEDAVRGVKYLEGLSPLPLFFANHPARRGRVSPHELRSWSDSGPRVFRGMEGAPGHQASKNPGEYGNEPSAESFQRYPRESYRTHGGFDWMTARLGGMWDSLLAEGRAVYITANSDSHLHHSARGADFYPGEYSKTIAWASRRDPAAVLEALRSGSMVAVHGDLIDRMEFYVREAGPSRTKLATMGATLSLSANARRVHVVIRVRMPQRANYGGFRSALHHVDLISGKLLGPGRDRDRFEHPTAQVARQFTEQDWKRDPDGYLRMEHVIEDLSGGFYLRVRGTDTRRREPLPDAPGRNPWSELWFYSNPIFVTTGPAPVGR